MHGSDRGERTKALILAIIVATVGVAAYAAMFISAGYQSGYNDRKAQVEAKRYASDAAEDIERACGKLPPSGARKCIGEIITAQRESERGESDLAAQWEAAEWSKWAGVAALAQLLATVIGLYYIKGTLDETRRAVEDTSEATDAMRESNKIAMDTFELASRPWLIPRIEGDYLKLNKTGFETQVGTIRYIHAQVWIENYGDMPATIIRSEAFILGGDPLPDPPTELFHVLTKGGKFYINETQGRWAEIAEEHPSVLDPLPFGTFIVPNDSIIGWLHDPPKIVCRIEYLDPAGNTRELGFAFRPSTVWTNDFKRWGEKQYNYDRKLRAPEDK